VEIELRELLVAPDPSVEMTNAQIEDLLAQEVTTQKTIGSGEFVALFICLFLCRWPVFIALGSSFPRVNGFVNSVGRSFAHFDGSATSLGLIFAIVMGAFAVCALIAIVVLLVRRKSSHKSLSSIDTRYAPLDDHHHDFSIPSTASPSLFTPVGASSKFVVIHSFQGNAADNTISAVGGSGVHILASDYKPSEEWVWVTTSSGESGYFPSRFVSRAQ
jgi:hypothetical protein